MGRVKNQYMIPEPQKVRHQELPIEKDTKTTTTKYLERMSKSNDQIIKLAELIAKEQERENTVSPDDIFKSIGD